MSREAATPAVTKGRDEGRIELLSRQFARRLGRTLSAAEQTALRTRFDQVGPARMGDVVLDLDADALGAWLADPDAR